MSKATCRTCGASGPPWQHIPSPLDPQGVGNPGHKMVGTPNLDLRPTIVTSPTSPTSEREPLNAEVRNAIGRILWGDDFAPGHNYDDGEETIAAIAIYIADAQRSLLDKVEAAFKEIEGRGIKTFRSDDMYHQFKAIEEFVLAQLRKEIGGE